MKCLIANRGEIALRAIQSCRELGLRSVWMTNELEKYLEPGIRADEIVVVSATANQSIYNDIGLIEEAIIQGKVTHLYPGYGFLSENSQLAQLCTKHHVCFLGPSAQALNICSHKSRAQKKAIEFGIETLRTDFESVDLKKDNILIKASQGGGGRGHRVVQATTDENAANLLKAAIEETKELSKRLFSSEEVHLEKYLTRARHVEAQFARIPSQPAVLMGTRDCSVQRNFQKVIEEGEVNKDILNSIAHVFPNFQNFFDEVDYVGLGTIEFLWDLEQNKLYFIEINCRIQVEHPVTELLINRNLVTTQFKIFLNNSLPKDFASSGHSIECRIYGENPQLQFLPSPLKIDFLDFELMPFVRWDWSLRQGDRISPLYDPMIGKLITWGRSRSEAIERAIFALKGLVIHGPCTNQSYLIDILQSKVFQENNHSTSWLDVFTSEWRQEQNSTHEFEINTEMNPSSGDSSSQKLNWKGFHRLDSKS